MVDFVIGNDCFGKILAEALGCEYATFNEECYPDGEPYPRIMKGTEVADYEEFEKKNVVFAPRTVQKQTKESITSHLHYTQRILGALTDKELYNAANVDLVFPYFLFGRHGNPKTDEDEELRIRDKGKDVGYRTLIRTFKGLGAKRIFTFDPHFFRKEGSTKICDMEVVCLSGVHALGRYLENKVGVYGYVISPDMGSSYLSNHLAWILDLDCFYLRKKRVSETEVESKEIYDAEGFDVIIADDIISTVGTIEKAVENIRNAGSVTVACVHPVLPEKGYKKLGELIESGKITEVVATDTINSDFSKTSVIPELVEALKT